MNTSPRVASFMTRCPHTIGYDQSLATAHEAMREHHIRHLPVLKAGTLVGLVSLRDLHLVETLQDVDPKAVPVEDAMSPEVFVVAPNTSLTKVASTLAERKLGSAVVVDHERVLGLFTTTDALRALVHVLEGRKLPS